MTSCVADTAPRFRLKLGFRESGNLGLGGGGANAGVRFLFMCVLPGCFVL